VARLTPGALECAHVKPNPLERKLEGDR
jgi:hypothetical protein